MSVYLLYAEFGKTGERDAAVSNVDIEATCHRSTLNFGVSRDCPRKADSNENGASTEADVKSDRTSRLV